VSEKNITNLSYLREIAGGEEEIIIETTEVFIQEIPHNLKKMQNHFANQEWDEIAKLAHKIKPNMTYMGMDRARELILKIEEQARSENITEDLGAMVVEFKDLCNSAVEELSGSVEELKSK
jgi:HPt (histidine-containing phosphotransfer) domain-containing protein